MKLLLCAVNSQYIHSNPALYALARGIEAMPQPPQWQQATYSINMSREQVLRELYQARPDVLACSAYIWNIEYLECLLGDLCQLLPQMTVLLGGPEATARSGELLQRLPGLSGVLLGEGEEVLPQLLSRLMAGETRPELPGVQWRGQAEAVPAPLPDLAQLPFLYTRQELQELGSLSKVIYYESSRGCPYGCTFCCSADQPLRQRPLELVLAELPQLAEAATQIKFVDRTFNADPARAAAITAAVLQLYRPGLSWHFEISPDQLPEQLLALWAQAPPGYLRLEVGVQSLYKPTLRAIHRSEGWARYVGQIQQIMAADNVHLHLDLIAGLPLELPESFAQAFGELHALMPHYLQLGFLKVLPGSQLAAQARQYGLVYSNRPPYQVLATPDMDADYLFRLSLADRALNAFYNSGRFRQTLHGAVKRWPGGALDFYLTLGEALRTQGPGGLSLPKKAKLLAGLLLPLDETLFFDLLRLDWLSYNDNQPLPPFLRSERDGKGRYSFQQRWQFGTGGLAEPEQGPQMLVFDWRAARIGATGRTACTEI